MNLSDHELVYCVRKINWRKAPAQFKTFRNYANLCDFRRDLEGVIWNSVSTPDGPPVDVNDLWADFKRAVVMVADRHAPVIQKRVCGVDNCPWLNRSIKVNMRHCDYFLRKARTANDSEDWARYRCFRNHVTNDIKKAKAAYNRRLIDEIDFDPKTFWKTMKKIMPREKRATSPNISVNGSVTSDKWCIANAFNKFFVWAQLCRLKAGKAVGLDNIPAQLLKDAVDTVAKPITIILNASLQSGRVPDDRKAARVIPLFKKGKAEYMDNYRPISLLPVLSKILEGAVHREHLRQHNILSPYQ